MISIVVVVAVVAAVVVVVAAVAVVVETANWIDDATQENQIDLMVDLSLLLIYFKIKVK